MGGQEHYCLNFTEGKRKPYCSLPILKGGL